MPDPDFKINPHTDRIKTINTNETGKIESVIFDDGGKLSLIDFIELFKMNLRTIVAGEIVTWEDHWRFTKQTDAKSFETYLQNVEAEGIMKGSKMSRTPGKTSNILMWILIAGAVCLAMVFLYFVLSKGGIKF